ncbi:MAG: tRNA 2-thiouridine(34) synthase MnmA [Bacteroidales bacterium]
MKQKVIIGLSGGVDSSVAAWLLKQQGYDVHGLFMINWKDSSVTLSGDCSWEEDVLVAQLVAKQLGIPLHVVDSSIAYQEKVAEYIFREYGEGRTPNPDILCNREIKFDVFLQEARGIGAHYYATGHYCRKESFDAGGQTIYRLLAGSDPNKDQSYFLCQLSQHQLKDALFPIGHLMKPEVRDLAGRLELASAAKKDSQGICFVGKVDLPTFLQQKLKPREGAIIEIPQMITSGEQQVPNDLKDLQIICSGRKYSAGDGKVVGTHKGAWFYTIGQRKGLNVGGTPEPLFVLSTDIENNLIFTGQGKNHPGLMRKGLFIRLTDIHYIRPDLTIGVGESGHFLVRIRYRQELQSAHLSMQDDGLYIVFDLPQRGITPGQFAAWYLEDELIGSGVIA